LRGVDTAAPDIRNCDLGGGRRRPRSLDRDLFRFDDRDLAQSSIEGEHPYVYLDGIVMKRSWAGEVCNVSLLVAIAVNTEGYREILGICEGAKEDLKHLKERGLRGVRLIISDACLGLAESAAEYFPEPRWQKVTYGVT
jgi:transposase-like protein